MNAQLRRCCLAAIFIAIASLPGLAAPYYVATDGSDDNEGSPAAPFRTIQRAADRTRSTPATADGTRSTPATIRVLLAMPVVEFLTVSIAAGAGTTRVEPAKLTFTPDNWMRPRTVAVHGKAEKLPVRFVIAHFDFDETLDAAAINGPNGEKRPFRTVR